MTEFRMTEFRITEFRKHQFSEFRSSEFRVFHAEFRIENLNFSGPQYHLLHHVVSSRERRFHRVWSLTSFSRIMLASVSFELSMHRSDRKCSTPTSLTDGGRQ